MILLVPYMPEVPSRHAPRLWQALVFVLILGIIHLIAFDTVIADKKYVDEIVPLIETDSRGVPSVDSKTNEYLKKRPLLNIAPAKGDWDWKRLLLANFLHGSKVHVLLNMIGVFAGVRICSTFLSFFSIAAIYLIGGSLGLLASMLLSTEVTAYIPHVGASAGTFALMGTYYIYNFRYRTRYFFWFPSRHGTIALRTSWFFFLDVILLEIVLSSGQFFPTRLDSVDHLAHVIGFLSGMTLAFSLRFILRWPSYLQTSGEYAHWRKKIKPTLKKSPQPPSTLWIEILELNPYNDRAKTNLCLVLEREGPSLPVADIDKALLFLSPTFIRMYTPLVARGLRKLLQKGYALNAQWLRTTPYDCIIAIAKHFTRPVEEHVLLYELMRQYSFAHPEDSSISRKLQFLMQKLVGIIPSKDLASRPAGQVDNDPTGAAAGPPSKKVS